MGFTLVDRPNRFGPHYYPTRLEPVLAIVVHCTAGLEDLDGVADRSAEATADYAGTTDRQVSWHSGSDTDSWVDLLPASCTAWHVTSYNSCTYGHEFSKGHTDWRTMPREWVEATLRQGATGLKRVAAALGIPLRKATRAELDEQRANFRAGRPWRPVGFISHAELQPEDRTDPGWVRGLDTFPWPRLFELMHDRPASPDHDLEDLVMQDRVPASSTDTASPVYVLDPGRRWRLGIAPQPYTPGKVSASWLVNVYAWGAGDGRRPVGVGGNPRGTALMPPDGGRIDLNEPWFLDLPAGTAQVSFEYSSGSGVAVGLFPVAS